MENHGRAPVLVTVAAARPAPDTPERWRSGSSRTWTWGTSTAWSRPRSVPARRATLRVLGYGEVTLVLGWPTASPRARRQAPAALPRRVRSSSATPSCSSATRATLRGRGVRVVPTERARATGRGRRPARLPGAAARAGERHAQPRAARGRRRDRGAALLETPSWTRVAERVDDRVGLDAQAANWAVDGEAARDCSTSPRRSCATPAAATGSTSTLFLSIYPWALRGGAGAGGPRGDGAVPRRRAPCSSTWPPTSSRSASTAGCPALLEAAAARRWRRRSPRREVRRYFVRDRRLWLLMQRLRRADRAWQRRVRRRPYPFLLPPPYRYGPPELPERKPA